MEQSPPLLQERFAARLNSLEEWEQTQLLACLQRIAAMMDVEDIDAAPVLPSGSVRATPEAVEKVLELESATNELLPDDQPSLANLS